MTLASTSKVIFSDGNPGTWELASLTNFPLPTATTHVLFELDAFENVLNDGAAEFDGHYADDVMVSVAVPEPCAMVLAGLGAIGLLFAARKAALPTLGSCR